MGNSLSMWEKGHWDAHPEIKNQYACPAAVHHDMTRPLSHYFISSGHNSYLTSDQLLGAAGTSTIILSLEAGCRVIELDCYTGPKGPICKHGGTATKPVLFHDCIVAIRDHAFKCSPYPVIITMENHADEGGQVAMVEILKKQLGEQLYIPDPEDTSAWKSPEALKHRFLIRTNVGKASVELKKIVYIANSKFKGYAAMNKLEHTSSSSLNEGAVEKLGKKLEITRTSASRRIKEGVTSFKKRISDTGNKAKDKGKGKEKVPEDAKKTAAEQEEEAVIAQPFTLEEAFAYATRHLLRVYPAGWRVGSGNYDPTIAWCLGASFAALNWQQWDKALWINEGKFKDNGGCGYVLKPDWMLQGATPSAEPRKLRVHVYSAFLSQGLSCLCGKDDLLVSLEVRGWHEDVQKFKTDYVQDSGRLVVDKAFSFSVSSPDMAVLLVILQDHDINNNDALGYFSLPLSTLQPGKYQLPMTRPGSGKKVPLHKSWIKVELTWEEGGAKADAGVPVSNPLKDH